MDGNHSRPSDKAAYRDLFIRSLDSILLVEESSGKIIDANFASPTVFRLSPEALEGTSIFDYCPETFIPALKKIIRMSTHHYYPKTYEIPLLVGDERIIASEMSASPLVLSDGREVLQLIFRDITEKKDSELKISQYIGQIESANHKLEILATTDEMTGLTNYRNFMRGLSEEHERSFRYRLQYSLIFCDLDHFKSYNDQNGHPAGDRLLKSFAAILKGSVRKTDLAARYGGEEFVVLCPHTEGEVAFMLADRIRAAVAATEFEFGCKQPLGCVSVSVGVSTFPENGLAHEEVLKAADESLYLSKSNGRNRVTRSAGIVPDSGKTAEPAEPAPPELRHP